MLRNIRLFGALKRFGTEGLLSIEMKNSRTAGELRAEVGQLLELNFPGESPSLLVGRSALVCDSRVLAQDELVDAQGQLALLPPVCGG